jgi:hypothetical protein
MYHQLYNVNPPGLAQDTVGVIVIVGVGVGVGGCVGEGVGVRDGDGIVSTQFMVKSNSQG